MSRVCLRKKHYAMRQRNKESLGKCTEYEISDKTQIYTGAEEQTQLRCK
jgi:hypothetical protein